MIKALEQAITELSQLPEVDQEQIGLKLLAHMEKLRALRSDIDEGLQELDEGRGIPLDIEGLIKKKNAERGRS
jgi:uncharacterized protein HemX